MFPNIDFKFRRGTKAGLETADVRDGSLNFTVDTNEFFLDIDGERISISSLNADLTEDEILLDADHLLENKIFLASDTFKLWRYNPNTEQWVCLNKESMSISFYDTEDEIKALDPSVIVDNMLYYSKDTKKLWKYTNSQWICVNGGGSGGDSQILIYTYESEITSLDPSEIDDDKFYYAKNTRKFMKYNFSKSIWQYLNVTATICTYESEITTLTPNTAIDCSFYYAKDTGALYLVHLKQMGETSYTVERFLINGTTNVNSNDATTISQLNQTITNLEQRIATLEAMLNVSQTSTEPEEDETEFGG